MSAVRWAREIAGFALSLLGALSGWMVLAPLAVLVPKRRDWIAVIGRQHGRFLDNAKYFFLDAASTQAALTVVFISEDPRVVAAITAHGLRALRYPAPACIWHLLRCGAAVVDSTDWIRHLRRFLLLRAHVVQLWHGVAFKRIELDKWRHETGRYRWFSSPVVHALRMALYRCNGRLIRYAAACSTSRFYRDEQFAQAFLAQAYPVTGYPRNGFALDLPQPLQDLAWSNVDGAVRQRLPDWLAAGRKLVLVTPTMRDSHAAPLRLDPDAVRQLDAFAAGHGFEFLFKFHPSDRHAARVHGEHLHVCAADSDVYPLFPHCAALVTDYSSIYMDFLWVDRPVLFLIADGDGYLRQDRELQFDPLTLMPGPRVSDWQALMETLATMREADTFSAERARLRSLAFDDLPQTAATENVLRCMQGHGWIEAAD